MLLKDTGLEFSAGQTAQNEGRPGSAGASQGGAAPGARPSSPRPHRPPPAALSPAQPRPRLRGRGSALREREAVPAPPRAGPQRRGATERAAGPLRATVGTCRPARAPLPPPSDARPLPVPSDPPGLRAAGKGSWPARGDLAGALALSVPEGSGADLSEPGPREAHPRGVRTSAACLSRTPSPGDWVWACAPRRCLGRLPAPRQARTRAGSCIFYQGGGSVRGSPVTPPLFRSFSRLFQRTHASASLSLLSLSPAPVSPSQFSEQLYYFPRRHYDFELWLGAVEPKRVETGLRSHSRG